MMENITIKFIRDFINKYQMFQKNNWNRGRDVNLCQHHKIKLAKD